MNMLLEDIYRTVSSPYSSPLTHDFYARFGLPLMLFSGFGLMIGIGILVAWFGKEWGMNTHRKGRT